MHRDTVTGNVLWYLVDHGWVAVKVCAAFCPVLGSLTTARPDEPKEFHNFQKKKEKISIICISLDRLYKEWHCIYRTMVWHSRGSATCD